MERRTGFLRLSKELKNSTIDAAERNSGLALLMVLLCFRIAGRNLIQAFRTPDTEIQGPSDMRKDFCQ
jgi:hypothetical protein